MPTPRALSSSPASPQIAVVAVPGQLCGGGRCRSGWCYGVRRVGPGAGARRIPADAAGHHRRASTARRRRPRARPGRRSTHAQQQLNAADLTGEVDVDKLLLDLATGFANRSGGSEQFEVIILARGQTITAGTARVEQHPGGAGEAGRAEQRPADHPDRGGLRRRAASVPGLAAGSTLTLPGTGRYQIYLIFPLTQEVATLGVLRYAVVTTGAILVILLTFIAALVSRQVVTPVRAARRAAESIASGNLHDRMQVRGQDDLARLADLDELHGLRAARSRSPRSRSCPRSSSASSPTSPMSCGRR